MFQYILFDLDGTLTNSKAGVTACVKYALQHMGIEETDEEKLTLFIGPPLVESFREIYGFNEEQTAFAVAKFRERYYTIGWKENELYPGMKEMLKQLQEKGCHLAVASSKTESSVMKILEYFQIREYFEVVAGSREDGTRNSKQAVMKSAFVQLGMLKGVSEASITDANCEITDRDRAQLSKWKCAMVGDRKFDINGAKAFGVASVAVTFGFAPKGEFETYVPDYLAADTQQLLEVLLEK